MKKTLLALAVFGAFAGAASAQSSVTLYGRLDAGIGRSDPKNGRVSDVDATTGVFTGTQAGNRFGVRGSEDLGGGLRAIFQIENGFSLDDGQLGQGGRLFGRQAYAGLAGGFGTVVLGRLASFSSGTGAFDRFGGLDPFGTGAGNLGFQATFASANALRLDNTVAYLTPNLSGFSAGVGYTFRAGGQELPGGSSKNNAGYVSYINYSAGPLYAVLTYDSFKLGEVAAVPALGIGAEPRQSHLQVGASWDFKVAKVSAAYANESKQFALGPAGIGFANTVTGTSTSGGALQAAGTDATAFALGVSVPLGAHRLAASYQSRTADAIRTNEEGKRSVWAVGYEYSFSRRTNAYAYFGQVNDKDGYQIGNWGGVGQMFAGLNHSF
jgi:general bacterial porin, GBP family